MPKQRTRFYKKRPFLALLAALVLVIALAFWYINRPSNKKVATIPSASSVGTSSNQNSNSNQSASGKSQTATNKTEPTQPANVFLITPWGNFVSNHYPGQNGAPNSETSACNTTPGATCYIKFTSGSQTRYLDKKIANGNGSVIWNWDVKSAGFSSGSWKVTAIATINGRTKTADDSLALVIQ